MDLRGSISINRGNQKVCVFFLGQLNNSSFTFSRFQAMKVEMQADGGANGTLNLGHTLFLRVVGGPFGKGPKLLDGTGFPLNDES